jgi:putative tryptophan/tyrosine transport system substrate-binding protein
VSSDEWIETEKNQMKKAITVLTLCALLFALCLPAAAQQPAKVPRIGFLASSGSGPDPRFKAFEQGLRELGYIEGKNIVIEYRYSEGSSDRLTELTADFVRRKVDVIVTGSTIAVRAAKKLTETIPVVMTGTGDPVGTGLVANLSRPGGNVTGLSSVGPDLNTKRLELLKETVAGASRVAVLFNGANPSNVAALKEVEIAARALGVQIQSSDVRDADGFERAFDAATRQRANAVLVQRDPLNNAHPTRIVALAAKSKLPGMYPGIEYVDAGGLMSYGVSSTDLYRRAATYVDKILKGAKPADLPVEQPTKFEFIINLKAAKQIGLTIPPNVLARADRVIR